MYHQIHTPMHYARGTDGQWPPTVGLPLSASMWEPPLTLLTDGQWPPTVGLPCPRPRGSLP
jgi:hypothetical protein